VSIKGFSVKKKLIIYLSLCTFFAVTGITLCHSGAKRKHTLTIVSGDSASVRKGITIVPASLCHSGAKKKECLVNNE